MADYEEHTSLVARYGRLFDLRNVLDRSADEDWFRSTLHWINAKPPSSFEAT